ncbi:hypothetical protein [Ktedonospora formicarum]|uniref:hypothetical protein n=1 Tax=Ktedonospora formicarum TaxID=2778364 RepID=UPI001C68FECE|nr:hypothetical protein [Ktedonospora formicarum]
MGSPNGSERQILTFLSQAVTKADHSATLYKEYIFLRIFLLLAEGETIPDAAEQKRRHMFRLLPVGLFHTLTI